MTTNETKATTARFEEGKTYFTNGAVDSITITVIKRTAKMIQIESDDTIYVRNVRYKISENQHGEFIKLGSHAGAKWIYAVNEYTADVKERDEQIEEAYRELAAKNREEFAEARRVAAMLEATVTPEAQDIATEAEINLANLKEETKMTRAEIEAEIKIIVEEIDEFRNELMVIEAETEDEDFDEATCTPQSHIDYLKSTIASNIERYNELQNMLNNLDPEPPRPETDGSEDDFGTDDAFNLLPEVNELNDVAEFKTQAAASKILETVVFTAEGNERRSFTVGNESVQYFNGELNFLWNKTYRAGISPIGECRYIVEVPDGRYVKFIRPTDEEFFAIMVERGACSFDEPETDGSEDNIELLAKLEQHYRNYRQYRWKADILNDFMDAYCTPESPVSSSDEFEIRRLFNKIAAWRNKAKDKFETLADEMMILAEKYQDVEPFWSRYKEIQHYIAVQEGFIDEEVEDIA